MLSQTTNFSVTPNLSKKIPFAPRAISNRADSFEMIGASMSFVRNAEIYGENEPAEYLYKLVSGSVRTSKILDDGRRQIGAFYLPGDIFGFEVSSEHRHRRRRFPMPRSLSSSGAQSRHLPRATATLPSSFGP